MAKLYSRINFQNSPSTATPVNATNLNKMDKGIDDIDTKLSETNDNLGVYKYHSTINLSYATSAAGTVPVVASAMYLMFVKRPNSTPTDVTPGVYLISVSTDKSMISIATLAAANGTPTITLNADKTLTVTFSAAAYANCILYRVY